MTEYEQHVERRARAVYSLFVFDEPTGAKPDWVERGNSLKQDEARRMARATMEADRAAGLALVPREATEGMVSSARIEHELLPKWEDLHNGINAAIRAGDILTKEEG